MRRSGWLRMGWRTTFALAALGLFAWVVTGALYFGPFGGADAERPQQFRDLRTRFAVPFEGQWYNVQIEFFVFDKGDGTFDETAAEAGAEMLARFPGAFEIVPGEVSAAFVPSGYWWPSRTVTWGYNPAGKTRGLTGDDDAIRASAAAWGEAGGAFHYAGGEQTSLGTGACGSTSNGIDGSNTVGWAAQSGSVLAVTCTWYGSGNPATAVEFDMQIDPDWAWTTGGAITVDLQSVITHEFGHALGLNHSPDDSSIMYASYCRGCDKRALTADDISGLVSIYGRAAAVAAPTAAPATPTPARPAASPVPSQPPVTSLGLRPGPNLVTWSNADSAAAAAFRDQAQAVTAIYGYNAATRTWQRFFPALPLYASNLKTLVKGQPYWVVTTGAAEVIEP